MDTPPPRPARSGNRWAWLPAQMPGVAKLLADKRTELGSDHVNECWKRGVVDGEPGWFWASEGSIMIGTLWEDAEILAFAQGRVTRSQALLVLRPPEGATP